MSNPKSSNVSARLREIVAGCHEMISMVTDKNYEKLYEEARILKARAEDVVPAVETLLDEVSSEEEEAWFSSARAAGWEAGKTRLRHNTGEKSAHALVSPCGRWAARLKSTGAFSGVTHAPSGMLASWDLVPVTGLAALTGRLGPVETREHEDPIGWVKSLPFNLRDELSSYCGT
jgi:hypothetical protein